MKDLKSMWGGDWSSTLRTLKEETLKENVIKHPENERIEQVLAKGAEDRKRKRQDATSEMDVDAGPIKKTRESNIFRSVKVEVDISDVLQLVEKTQMVLLLNRPHPASQLHSRNHSCPALKAYDHCYPPLAPSLPPSNDSPLVRI
jgi:hypothetical protein